MADFKWRKVSEKEREEIARDAKKLLNEFSVKISKVKMPAEHFENDDESREEGDGWKTDAEFRSIVFDNAPLVDNDIIIAEKGAWK